MKYLIYRVGQVCLSFGIGITMPMSAFANHKAADILLKEGRIFSGSIDSGHQMGQLGFFAAPVIGEVISSRSRRSNSSQSIVEAAVN